MLERQRLRNDVLTRLWKNTGANRNVFKSRARDLEDHEFPALLIYTPQQAGETDGHPQGPPTFKDALTLVVEARVQAMEGYDDKLDALCEQVEGLLLESADFVKQYEGVLSYSTETKFNPEGLENQAVAVMTMTLGLTTVYEPRLNDAFKNTDIELDAIDVADPNTGNPGYPGGNPGPDGRIEGHVSAEPEQ